MRDREEGEVRVEEKEGKEEIDVRGVGQEER